MTMAIAHLDIERKTYAKAVAAAPPGLAEARSALRSAVKNELDRGTNREHVLMVLEQLLEQYELADYRDGQNAVLDVMDALWGAVHPSQRL